jgi:hypothetical protein
VVISPFLYLQRAHRHAPSEAEPALDFLERYLSAALPFELLLQQKQSTSENLLYYLTVSFVLVFVGVLLMEQVSHLL